MGILRIAYNTNKMENNMINELFKELADIEQIEAIALGGSRSGENYDDKSDYDVYIYSDSAISEETRTAAAKITKNRQKKILSRRFNMGMIEETDKLMLDWNKISGMNRENKVIPVAVQNSITMEVILIAYTNEEAFLETVKKKKLVLWSTSRNKLWFKGAESGNTFTVDRIFVNCEQNSLVYRVTPDKGNICHTSCNGVPNNCYYRELDTESMKLINLNEKGE